MNWARHAGGSVDLARIDVNHEDELLYWMEKLQASPVVLRQAVRLVGPRLQDVSAFVKHGRLPEGFSCALRAPAGGRVARRG